MKEEEGRAEPLVSRNVVNGSVTRERPHEAAAPAHRGRLGPALCPGGPMPTRTAQSPAPALPRTPCSPGGSPEPHRRPPPPLCHQAFPLERGPETSG